MDTEAKNLQAIMNNGFNLKRPIHHAAIAEIEACSISS
jgi:hypothetical protein